MPFNNLESGGGIGGRCYLKKRRWYAGPLIFGGNLYLKILRAHVHILPCRAWMQWERQVYQVMLGRPIEVKDGNTLILPHLEGETLSAILRSEKWSNHDKLEAIGHAVHMIRILHQSQLLWPDGVTRRFSHGDATAENVLCDPATQRCYFIDFETLHDAWMAPEWRHADDLRTLLYSAAECVEPGLFQSLCQKAVQSYRNQPVLKQLKHYTETSKFHPNVYHLAQSKLGFEKKGHFDECLSDALNEVLQKSLTEPEMGG